MREGANVAVEEINAAGGINGKKLSMEVFDDEANPQKAVIAAEKIATNKNFLFVLGHNNSGNSIATLPIFEKVGLPLISPTNSAIKISQLGHKNYFRVCPHDGQIGKEQVLLGVKELGLTKSAILWENTDWGIGLRDYIVGVLADFGIKIIGDETFVPAVDRDYSAQITKFKGLGVDVVYFAAEYTAGALFLRQARSLGFNAQAIGGQGTTSPKLIEIGKDATEGFFTIGLFDPNDTRPQQAEFIKKYLKRTGKRPGDWESHSYDIVYLVKAAIELGAKDRATLIQKLHEIKGFKGVTGTIEFDDKGDVVGKKLVILQVKNGDFVRYFPTKY
jgi:branched-chain amino acid transport system substrate-binding protein